MESRGLILLLHSGFVVICHLQSDQFIRRFHHIDNIMSQNEAKLFCRSNYTDLARIDSLAQNTEAQKEVGSRLAWIGLLKSDWKWSQPGQVPPTWFSWDQNNPGTGGCVTISRSGFWFAKECSNQYYFVCYDGETNSPILVQQLMNWTAAQSYCRKSHTDLTTINNVQDNFKITTLLLLQPKDFWIGLNRYSWVWSDGSSTSYLSWGFGQPDDSVDCATIDGSSGYWSSGNCDDQHTFLCYEDFKPSVWKHSVKVQLRGGPADLNDPTVQESILQQMREKLLERGITEEVKMRWTTQPDGNVFHREEERPPSADCEIEDGGTV